MYCRSHFVTGLSFYAVSTAAVLVSVFCSAGSFRDMSLLGVDDRLVAAIQAACTRHDGNAYIRIATDGYEYDPNRKSSVAFFPAFPFSARLVSAAGITIRAALILIANTCFALSLIGCAAYFGLRSSEVNASFLSVAAMAFWPAGFFFRMAYSESMFLAGSAFLLYGFARNWPITSLAVISGLITATRPVGIAATCAFLCHVVLTQSQGSLVRRIAIAAAFCPLAAWGLIAFMVFQYVEFGNAFAFAETQVHWRTGAPLSAALLDKAVSLLTFEPLWACYCPTSLRYWGNWGNSNPLFNWAFWNPILFTFVAVVVAYGYCRSWITHSEAVFSAILLLLPYLTRAYEMSMASHGRFSAVVIPAYLVIGRILAARPRSLSFIVFLLFALLLAMWSFEFAEGEWFY